MFAKINALSMYNAFQGMSQYFPSNGVHNEVRSKCISSIVPKHAYNKVLYQ